MTVRTSYASRSLTTVSISRGRNIYGRGVTYTFLFLEGLPVNLPMSNSECETDCAMVACLLAGARSLSQHPVRADRGDRGELVASDELTGLLVLSSSFFVVPPAWSLGLRCDLPPLSPRLLVWAVVLIGSPLQWCVVWESTAG